MSNIIIIEKDQKVALDLRNYLRDLDEKHKTHIFQSKEEFEDRYFKVPEEPEEEENSESDKGESTENPTEASKNHQQENKQEDQKEDKDADEDAGGEGEEEGVDLDMLATIDLIIFGLGAIPDFKTTDWIGQTRKSIKEFGYLPESKKIQYILLKWEDDGINKTTLLDPRISDMFYLPLDRQLAIQKLEIILSIPEVIKPSYLFVQSTDLTIQIAKQTQAERINDVGLAIRNPMPLKKGLLSQFYLDIGGRKDERAVEVFGKVQFCEPHPEAPEDYLVTYYFFGVDKETLKKIRSFLGKNSNYRHLKEEDADQFKFNPDNLFLNADQKRVKNVVVIDTDEGGLEQMVNQLNKNMDQLRISGETSYFSFYQKYLNTDRSTSGTLPSDPNDVSAVSERDMGSHELTFDVQGESLEIIKAPELEDPSAEILGHSVSQLMDLNDAWVKTLFPTDLERTPLKEAIETTLAETETEKVFFIKNSNDEYKAITIKMKPGMGEGIVNMTFSPTTNEIVRQKILREAAMDSIDALIIDSAVVPGNVTGWAENLNETLKSKGYLKNKEPLKIIVTAPMEKPIDHQKFKSSFIAGVFYRPLDLRSFLATLSNHLKNEWTIQNYENLDWLDTRLSLQIAKDTQLKEISEFGATIQTPKPIASGTFLFLRGEIFDNAPRGNLCGRFYLSDKDDDGLFNNYLLYFGINEEFMVFARNWFREVYAESKKEKESSE